MSHFVIDASVLIKTVVEEDGSAQAVALLESGAAVAPDLIMPECANILWKKTRRGEYTTTGLQHWAINLREYADPATPRVDSRHFRYSSAHPTAFNFYPCYCERSEFLSCILS